jgi:TP901 family phage tail tape measure protein
VADSLGKLFVDLLLRDDTFAKDLKAAQRNVADFGGAVTDLTDNIAGKFTLAVEAGAAAIAGMAAASAVLGADFEHQINKVAVLAGASVQPLADAAREFGKATSFSASEAASAMESLAQAGFGTADIIGGTSAALALAAASGSELADATKIVATTMSQFQLTAADSARISDVFTAALNTSQLNMEGLTLAMSYAGTVGASFGHSLEETSAAVAMFSNLGLEGSKAGTAFRMSMSMAANVSKEAERALAKYGLTAKDINPELHNFGEILQVVGEKGVTASDAMAIFGTEVGGNVAALAQQAVNANTEFSKSFDGILNTLQTSSGEAERTAAQMQVTVASAWEQATGSFEEILLSVYDTYSGPLRDLLVEVTEFLNDLGAAFQRNAGGLEAGLGGALDQLTTWLHDNRNDIIMAVVDFTDGIAQVASMLAGLVPYLDEIAVLMGAIWVVNQVASFASALGGAIDVVFGMQAALAALGVEITAMTGGLYLAVVAIGVIIAAVVSYIAVTNDATLAAERLTSAQTKQAALNDERFQAQIAHMEELLAVQRQAASAELDQIAAGKQVSKARKAELEQIVSLEAEQAALLVRQGKLIESSGELRTAASMVDEAMDTASTEKLASAYKGLRGEQAGLAKQAIALGEQLGLSAAQVSKATGVSTDDLEAMGYKAKALRAEFDEGNISAETYGLAIAKATGATDIATMEDAQIKFEALAGQIKDLDKAVLKFKGDAAIAQRSMVEETERAIGHTRDQSREVAEFSKTMKDAQRRAEEEAASQSERLREKETKDAAAHARVRLQTELDLTIAQRAELLDILAKDAEERKKYEAEVAAFHESMLAAMNDSSTEFSYGMSRELGEALNTFEFTAMRTRVTWRDVVEDAMDAIGNLPDTTRAATRSIAARFQQVGAAIRTAFDRNRSGGIEMTDLLVGAGELLKTGFMANLRALGAIGSAALRGIGHLLGLTKEQLDENGDGAVSLGEKLRGIGKIGAAAFGALSNAARSAFSSIAGMIGEITGFAFNLMDAVEEVAAVLEQTGREVPGAAAGRGGQQANVAGLGPSRTASAASGVVTGMVDEAVSMVRTFAEAAPALITALANELPRLVEAIAAYLPGALQAIIDSIPVLVESFVEQLPVLIDALIQALPPLIDSIIAAVPRIIAAVIEGVMDIVVAIVEALPTIVGNLLDMIPDVIEQLLDAIPVLIVKIVEAIPVLITTILTRLPEIITALIYGIVDAIPLIVLAVVEAIPQIIIAIVEAIPEIVMAVIGSIPYIITTIIGMIPDIIIALSRALPDLIPAIVLMIPTLVIEIIKALPAIISALVKGIVVELIFRFPEMVGELFKAIWNALGDLVTGFVDLIKKALGIGGGKNKDKEDGSAYSGIDYVPAPMRVKVHPGEAILPADRNAQRLRRETYPAGGGAHSWGASGAGAGGGAPAIELAVVAEGRLLEAVQVRASSLGRAPLLSRAMRRAGGVTVGFTRGKFSPWSL